MKCARYLLLACSFAVSVNGHAAQSSSNQPRANTATTLAPELASRVWQGDLDGMKQRRLVRMLVVYSKTFYFLDKARQHGVTYAAGIELEKALNASQKDRARQIRVVFIPTRRDQLLTALAEGRGDIAAGNLTITPERLKLVDFSKPLTNGVSEILVTKRGATAPTSVEQLSGTTLYVRKSSSYYESLQALNARFKEQRKALVQIGVVDE